MKTLLVLNCLFILIGCGTTPEPQSVQNSTQTPAFIKVPDETTAIAMAKALWLPIYGEKIYADTPYTCRLQDSIWIVEGTLPKGMKGGVPYAHIGQQDGKVYTIGHGK